MQSIPAASALRFVYDCPDDVLIDIFTTASGSPALDVEAARRADREHQCAVKNARGELVSVLVVPEGQMASPPADAKSAGGAWAAAAAEAMEAAAPGTAEAATPAVVDAKVADAKVAAAAGEAATVEEHSIAMTRSLGDFYAHHFGIISEPEIRTIDLDRFLSANGWVCCTLHLASDGVWDLWSFAEVGDMLLPPTSRPVLAIAASFCEATRAKGEDYFGESADNLTGLVVPLRPQPSVS